MKILLTVLMAISTFPAVAFTPTAEIESATADTIVCRACLTTPVAPEAVWYTYMGSSNDAAIADVCHIYYSVLTGGTVRECYIITVDRAQVEANIGMDGNPVPVDFYFKDQATKTVSLDFVLAIDEIGNVSFTV